VDNVEFGSRLKSGIGDHDLWALRGETITKVSAELLNVGLQLMEHRAPGDIGHAVRTTGALIRMLGELSTAAGRMLSGTEHYAGAALLRQVAEIEYLAWTFKDQAAINAWLESSYADQKSVFAPEQLQRSAKGRFLQEDYLSHCEQGGHPLPRGIPLLAGMDIANAQLLLVDLLIHCWRTWNQVYKLLSSYQGVSAGQVMSASPVTSTFAQWGKRDPLFQLMIERLPDATED
jgi:hypothetical protein